MESYHVSKKTINRAIGLLEAEGLVRGVPSQGVFVRDPEKYHVHRPPAHQPRMAVLCPRNTAGAMISPYFNQIYFGVERSIEDQKGGRAYLISCRNKTISEIRRELHFLDINSIATVEFENKKMRHELELLNIPMVHLELMDMKTASPVIMADNTQGGVMVFDKLYDLGHRKILFLAPFIPSINRCDPMSDIRWKGIRKQARKRKCRHVKREIISLEFTKVQRDTEAVLEKYSDYTAIIAQQEPDFLKMTLEKRPSSDTKKLDLVLFSLEQNPFVIHRKPVWFCKWDGYKMGELAVKTLLDKKKKYPKIQYMPMHLDRNL
jgi:DNA-binding LacI/PurR family transcriptional regulator